MGKFKVALTETAKGHLILWKQSGKIASLKRIERIFKDLSQNPYKGIGHPESLKYKYKEYWSRRIDKKNRIVYFINEKVVTVFVVSVFGHYSDK